MHSDQKDAIIRMNLVKINSYSIDTLCRIENSFVLNIKKYLSVLVGFKSHSHMRIHLFLYVLRARLWMFAESKLFQVLIRHYYLHHTHHANHYQGWLFVRFIRVILIDINKRTIFIGVIFFPIYLPTHPLQRWYFSYFRL